MADALVQISDVVVPEIFTPYIQQLSATKSRLVQSGALAADSMLNQKLAGGGLTFNVPSWQDLADEDDNVSTDAATDVIESLGHSTSQEIAVRMSRNQVWSDADLSSALAGSDPMDAIASRVANYWSRRLQAAFVATIKGVFADNDAAPAGTEHTQYDLTNDVSSSSYQAGVTDFTAGAFIDAAVTAGDSAEDLGILMVHSIVYSRMQKNNLIDFVPDSDGKTSIPTFLGRTVIVDDSLPYSGNVYDSWMFGVGAVRLGVGTPDVPTEIDRIASAGNGGGQEKLHSRVEWCIHPVGHKFAGTAANGGPSNAATSNNLAHAGSWERVYPERKQIHIARLKTREA